MFEKTSWISVYNQPCNIQRAQPSAAVNTQPRHRYLLPRHRGGITKWWTVYDLNDESFLSRDDNIYWNVDPYRIQYNSYISDTNILCTILNNIGYIFSPDDRLKASEFGDIRNSIPVYYIGWVFILNGSICYCLSRREIRRRLSRNVETFQCRTGFPSNVSLCSDR